MIRAIVTVGYVGYIPFLPGSWGSAVALPVGWLLHWAGGWPLLIAATVVVYGVGYWATRIEISDKPDKDPHYIVIDEVAGMWVALMPLSAGLGLAGAPPYLFPWPGWLTAFFLFRVFDMRKTWPVSWADRRKGPMGVMFDDIIAGAMAALLVALAGAVAHGGVP